MPNINEKSKDLLKKKQMREKQNLKIDSTVYEIIDSK